MEQKLNRARSCDGLLMSFMLGKWFMAKREAMNEKEVREEREV